MYEISCEISVRCHMIFVLYAEGYMYDETYEKLGTAFKVQQRQKMCAGEGRKAESGCTLHAVFPLGQSIAGSAKECKREDEQRKYIVGYSTRRTAEHLQSICLVRVESTRAGLESGNQNIICQYKILCIYIFHLHTYDQPSNLHSPSSSQTLSYTVLTYPSWSGCILFLFASCNLMQTSRSLARAVLPFPTASLHLSIL